MIAMIARGRGGEVATACDFFEPMEPGPGWRRRWCCRRRDGADENSAFSLTTPHLTFLGIGQFLLVVFVGGGVVSSKMQ